MKRRRGGRFVAVPRDLTAPEERPEDLVAPRTRVLRPLERVVQRGSLRETGDESRLLEVELAGRLREVRLRRRLDPVGVVSVVDLVHVGLEDPVLRPGPVELEREARLLQLARE